MRIALLCNLAHPIAAPFAGGLERQTHQLATGLVAAGEEVTLFAHPESDPRFDLVPIPLVDSPRTRGPAHTYRRVRAYRRMMRAVAAGDFDVIHNNTLHWVPPAWLVLRSAPALTTLHTPPYHSLRLAAAMSRLHRNPLAVSISATLGQRWAGTLGYVPGVVANGVDPNEWPLSLTPEPKNAIWYGRISPEKAPHLAILAARAAGYRLRLAGRIDDETYFRTRIEPLLGEDFSYIGTVGGDQLKQLIGAATVCLFTSLWHEPFGLVLLEAPACGTPVIATRLGAAVEVVSPETGVLVSVPEHLVNAGDSGADAGAKGGEAGLIAELAAAFQPAARLDRATCRAAVLERFRLSRMIEGYRATYRTLVRENGV